MLVRQSADVSCDLWYAEDDTGFGDVTAPAITRTELCGDGNEHEKWRFRYLQKDVHYARCCLGLHPTSQAEPT